MKIEEILVDFRNLSTKYLGDTAATYNAERIGRKWQSEQIAAEKLLSYIPPGTAVLDVPVGTGRLFPFYKQRRFEVTGLDISPDMLAEARAAASDAGVEITLREGDIRAIPFADASFELVVCLRFLNWIDKLGVAAALSELSRVTANHLLIGIRYLTAWRDISGGSAGSLRYAMRSVGRYRARKWGLVYHERSFVHDQIRALGLQVIESRHVERRWDGTDYVFFLLAKEHANGA